MGQGHWVSTRPASLAEAVHVNPHLSSIVYTTCLVQWQINNSAPTEVKEDEGLYSKFSFGADVEDGLG